MKPILVSLICLLASLVPAGAQQKKTFSIDDVLSAPYCSNLTAGRSRVAWVVSTEGIHNIWTAALPAGKPVRLTQNTTDDGQELGALRFSSDDKQLAYVRGGSKNGAGISPNPTSDPAGAEQAVWIVDVAEGAKPPVRVAAGASPVWSPDGRKLLFGLGGQVHVADTQTPGQSQPLFSVRGSVVDFSWSPDGKKVLFASNRGYHNLIGVYDTGLKTVLWLAPGVDRDGSPVWSPDGRQVAFVRVPGQKHGELPNIQGGNRFAIWTADALTGAGRERWHSPGDDGGFAQYYPTEPLRWTRANQLLFFSEHENWMHVYRLLPDGESEPTDLTPGACEAEETAVSPDGAYLYFSSNCATSDPLDTDRRHLWRVATNGTGKPTMLTRGTGIETDPVLVADHIVYRSAGWNRSTGIVAQKIAGSTATTIFPGPTDFDASRFPTAALTEPLAVVFRAADGVAVHGQLFLPPNRNPTNRKGALIFLHGGPMRQMLLGWHYRGTYYANAYAMNQYLATQGYAVLSINYRAGIGYGRAFRRADRQGPRGASEYQDVLAGARYLQNRADVQPPGGGPLRIGLWGGSYGGYLTAMGLARNSDLFVAGVDLHGVHDWAWRGNMFSPGGGWGIGPDDAKTAFESSPNHNLDFWQSPCLFVHGDDDRNVTFAETVDLVQKLRDRHVPTEVLIFPDDVHSFLLHKNWLKTYHAMDAFFGKYMPAQPLKPDAADK